MVEDNIQPASYGDIRLINGEQRSGKSTTGVAFAADEYYEQLDGIVSPSGEVIKAKCLTKDEKQYLGRHGITPNIFKYVRVLSDDGKESKIIRIPKDFIVSSPVHIFANFHLYGLYYSYISLADIVQYMNEPLFNGAWILSDESVMTDTRNSMERAGKLIANFGATIGKRNAHMCLMTQYNEMIERRYRLFHTMRVLCSYESKTKIITCEIKKRGEPAFSYDYWAVNYFRFFDTNELVPVPQDKIDRTLAGMYAART